MSICLPVYHAGDLKGVTAVDIRVADIIGDINYYQHGEYSYTFLIDGTGMKLIIVFVCIHKHFDILKEIMMVLFNTIHASVKCEIYVYINLENYDTCCEMKGQC